MRRKVMTITALVCLIAAGSAYAATAFNTYSATNSFTGVGSKHKPAAASLTLHYVAQNATSGNRAEPLIDIKSVYDGISSNYKYFPTCSAKKIGTRPKYNTACPAKSLVATGSVMSVLGPANDMSTTAATAFSCKLQLVVYNSGGGKLTYFFRIVHNNDCGALYTGAAQPYVATVTEKNGNLYQDVPLPPDVSTAAGGISGFYGSLEKETLTFKKQTVTVKIHGKKTVVPFLQSTGCTRGKRPWSVTFTATNGSVKQSKTITGKAKC